ncbi:uncharacterized protein LOC111031631, partial [Myzus persicae]|uniref:uncharacterized protein LOC111031631 n=1 Tax=Myzus persicae TaxID=13164 RepID=UPI000B934FED
MSSSMDAAAPSFSNQTSHQLSAFQLPKRTFPVFSGEMTEWQGFDDLFTSILSHAPELPDVERFEFLKMSLKGEALSLISHLALTATNYTSAWKILRSRYGNKRDLARIHLDALLANQIVKSNDGSSIKTQINTILENTAALDNLDFVTRQWSPLLVHIFEKHLDYELRARWELVVGENHYPQISDFVDFLRTHLRSAEIYSSCSSSNRHNSASKPHTSVKQSSFNHRSSSSVLATTSSNPSVKSCPLCNAPHSIRSCTLFTDKPPNERFLIAKTHRLCINCLGTGHSSGRCPSNYTCQSCKKSHHSLLHFNSTANKPNTFGPAPSNTLSIKTAEPVPGAESHVTTTSCLVRGQPQRIVLLSTAIVDVYAADGRRHALRALLDSGSQASFITERAACALMLRLFRSSVSVTTFASSDSTVVWGKCNIKMSPAGQQAPSFSLDVSIVPHITGSTPRVPVAFGHWDHINSLSLVDPSYNTPGPIDLLLGADLLPSVFLDGTRKGQVGEPLAMNSVFGWVLMGPTDLNDRSSVATLSVNISEPIDSLIKKFCSGRFVVTLPFLKPRPLLGDSKTLALQRFKALECRLNRNKDLQDQYAEFMRDYLTAGHMELIPSSEQSHPFHYYIPHHCVLKPDSLTTKLRVVFNASAKTSAGISLNDSMYTGPKLQPDIQVVLLRARLWKYLFMADIRQMYRQILIQPADRDYLRILWRFSSTSPIDEYRLCTVT